MKSPADWAAENATLRAALGKARSTLANVGVNAFLAEDIVASEIVSRAIDEADRALAPQPEPPRPAGAGAASGGGGRKSP